MADARVIANTPLWVCALLAYLVWQGCRSLRSRTLPIWQMLVVPLIFFLMGLSRLVLGPQDGWQPLAAWFVAAALFALLALIRGGPRLIAIDRKNGRVTRAASMFPLIRNVTVFLLQYGIAIASALHLDGHVAAALMGRAVSGATAGYFAGWTMSLLRTYRRAAADQTQTRPPADPN